MVPFGVNGDGHETINLAGRLTDYRFCRPFLGIRAARRGPPRLARNRQKSSELARDRQDGRAGADRGEHASAQSRRAARLCTIEMK